MADTATRPLQPLRLLDSLLDGFHGLTISSSLYTPSVPLPAAATRTVCLPRIAAVIPLDAADGQLVRHTAALPIAVWHTHHTFQRATADRAALYLRLCPLPYDLPLYPSHRFWITYDTCGYMPDGQHPVLAVGWLPERPPAGYLQHDVETPGGDALLPLPGLPDGCHARPALPDSFLVPWLDHTWFGVGNCGLVNITRCGFVHSSSRFCCNCRLGWMVLATQHARLPRRVGCLYHRTPGSTRSYLRPGC